MVSSRDVDRLLWAVAEARRLRAEELARPSQGVSQLSGEVVLEDTEFTTDWQQPAATSAA
jgi:hypothetical protein